jgi:hypothetical protein
MYVHTVAYWIHLFTMVLVLGGYIFFSAFWWPVLMRLEMDVDLRVHLAAQTLRRFFTAVVLALTLQVLTGGLYLLPPAYRALSTDHALALAAFHRILLWKLAAVFVVLILVPMQLFGMALRLTRMAAGVYPLDAKVVARLGQRMQAVSLLIVGLLTLVVLLSTQL